LETEKIVWEKTYGAGCDRSAVTMDGRRLYVPSGWWYEGDDSGVLIVNAENGDLIKRINVGPQAHNSIVGQKLFIFDATKMPPTPKGQVELSQGGHGWVSFSLDGHYAWTHTPDVFDVRTKKLVATLKDENGKPVSGSKFIEIHFRNGKVVQVGNEFGLGRK
jgi:hypothetical protein